MIEEGELPPHLSPSTLSTLQTFILRFLFCSLFQTNVRFLSHTTILLIDDPITISERTHLLLFDLKQLHTTMCAVYYQQRILCPAPTAAPLRARSPPLHLSLLCIGMEMM